MVKTTIQTNGEPSIAAQRKAMNILIKAFGRRHGVELEGVFKDEVSEAGKGESKDLSKVE
ncbi:hypothetical protein [Enterococcus sp. AZ126]|uniref:hypothetical protein n=1 Tax=Enterococcus sp. AZ126 TaxID=2774635 RepID=UPI003F1EB10B